MLGTWNGVSHVAVIGSVQKHHTPADSADVTFLKTNFTLVIEAEAGRNFAGHWKSKFHEEKIADALMSDMTNGVIVDSDGSATIKRIEKDCLALCYVHVPSPNKKSSVAAALNTQGSSNRFIASLILKACVMSRCLLWLAQGVAKTVTTQNLESNVVA